MKGLKTMSFAMLMMLLGIYLPQRTHGQAKEQKGCKQSVMSCIQKMRRYTKPKPGRYYYFKIKTRVEYIAAQETPPTELTSEIIIGEKLRINRSSLYGMYLDEENQFFVLHPQKLVNWQSSPKGVNQDSLFQLTSFNQDSLIRTSVENACRTQKVNGKDLLKVSLVPHAEVQEAYGLSYLEVLLDPSKARIWEVTNYFKGHEHVAVQRYTYQEMNYQYKGKVRKTASSYVFQKEGKLLPALKEYELIDLRKNEELGSK